MVVSAISHGLIISGGIVSRVQTDPGKPGKMVFFKKSQGNPGKPREKFVFFIQLREFYINFDSSLTKY
jgi:hypothetical protein